MKKSLTARVSAETADHYNQNWPNSHQGICYVLEAWPVLYRRTLHELRGVFTRHELMLILDVHRGLILTSGLAGQHLAAEVQDGIDLEGMAEKWKLPNAGRDLTEKLATLTTGEKIVLEVWATGYWAPNNRAGADTDENVNAWMAPLLSE